MAIIDPSKTPTLEEVNAHLLERLDEVIQDADPEALLKVAETVAKLNASSRNNDLVAARIDEAEQQAKKEQQMFGHLSEATLLRDEGSIMDWCGYDKEGEVL